MRYTIKKLSRHQSMGEQLRQSLTFVRAVLYVFAEGNTNLTKQQKRQLYFEAEEDIKKITNISWRYNSHKRRPQEIKAFLDKEMKQEVINHSLTSADILQYV